MGCHHHRRWVTLCPNTGPTFGLATQTTTVSTDRDQYIFLNFILSSFPNYMHFYLFFSGLLKMVRCTLASTGNRLQIKHIRTIMAACIRWRGFLASALRECHQQSKPKDKGYGFGWCLLCSCSLGREDAEA